MPRNTARLPGKTEAPSSWWRTCEPTRAGRRSAPRRAAPRRAGRECHVRDGSAARRLPAGAQMVPCTQPQPLRHRSVTDVPPLRYCRGPTLYLDLWHRRMRVPRFSRRSHKWLQSHSPASPSWSSAGSLPLLAPTSPSRRQFDSRPRVRLRLRFGRTQIETRLQASTRAPVGRQRGFFVWAVVRWRRGLNRYSTASRR